MVDKPLKPQVVKKRKHVRINTRTIQQLTKLGGGNLSKGIDKAAEIVRADYG